VAEDKKTQIGTPGRTVRPTASQSPVAAAGTPVPAASAAEMAKATATTSYLPQTVDPLLGTTIAERYQVIRKLGEGGMGAVYLAMHTILEKQVALKVLHGEFARKPDLVDRFMQEAKAASRIRHENVIDISDFGATPDGYVFFAMELLSGHDLHEDIARAKLAGQLLPWSRSKKIFLQICGALAAAHARGIVHRDLKPENVYLVDFLGDPDFVKLLDFGIAKLTDVSQSEGGRKLTKTGMLFGTPEYMSPEQARGENVDHRVDVYAMGCILFQLVTNRVPFEAENFMGVLSQHLTAEPPQIPPEIFDRIGAPRELAGVIDRALEKDRDRRWQTIEELANAVRQVSGDPLPADKSQPNRAPSVPSPSETTRPRTPTSGVPQATGAEKSARVKTQWTGNLTVPEASAEAAPAKKSKLPLILGAVVLLGGGAAAAVFALGGDEGSPAADPGSAAEVASGSAQVVVPDEPPPPPPEVKPALPEHVEIVLESVPKGALVTDLSNNSVLGPTPQRFKVLGSDAPRQFKFTLRGYGDSTVELVPNRPQVAYTETLQRGKTRPNPVTKVPDDPAIKAPGDLAKPADTKPADTKPADTKPADTKPADIKPPDKPNDDCPEDEPCLKVNIPGMGSGN
jgi:serine/threonine protein kinase